MPAITHDGRSFMIDGRRIWLVSGRVPYARVPRAFWADRIAMAKHAGLNTIETPVFWNRHEPRAGRFDFTGENDLRHFVDLVGKAGLYCILNIGPSIGSEWDFGGLPAYLREKPVGPRLRTNDPQFLECCSRYITSVAEQIRGWQVTAPGTGGPIVLLGVECEWTCGHNALATGYLGELTRYIREAGLNVPLVNSNNLWQSVEGQIDGWAGSTKLLATMRQLSSVRPDQPRVVIDFETTHAPVWGQEPPAVMAPRQVQTCLAKVLAGGGQLNNATFCGGTNFGSSGGRTDDGPATYATTASDHGCALTQTGETTDLYHATRPIQMLASRFGKVFAHLDPAYQPVLIAPPDHDDPEANAVQSRASRGKHGHVASPAQDVSVLHVQGSQGGAIFLFHSGQQVGRVVKLLLSSGTELDVPLGTQPVVCCMLDVNIHGRSHLDDANVSLLGVAGNVLVAYGPAGSLARLTINDSPIEAALPTTDMPVVLEHEGLVIVLVREEALPRVAMTDDAVLVGVAGLSPSGVPIAPAGEASYVRIDASGRASKHAFEAGGLDAGNARGKRPKGKGAMTARVGSPAGARSAASRLTQPKLGVWSCSPAIEQVEGDSPRYASITRLGGLAAMGVQSGYGWYRVGLSSPKARTALLDFGLAGDRLHVYHDGAYVGLAGNGPGATTQLSLHLKKGKQQLVILAENLGRFASGVNVGEPKGLVDSIFEVAPIKLPKPALVRGQPVTLLTFRAPLWDITEGDTTISERLAWTFKSAPKTRLLARIGQPPSSGLVMLNEKPVAYVDRSGPTCVLLPEDALQKGNNLLELTVVTPEQFATELVDSAASMSLFEVLRDLSEDAGMAFAKWEPPTASSYGAPRKSVEMPTWWKSMLEFASRASGPAERPEAGVMLHLAGMTKGQIFVNGTHLGRYFVSTKQGKLVPPQHEYFIPASMLMDGQANEIVLFDEHGASPAKVRVRRV